MEKRSPAVPEPMEMLAGHITDYLHYLKHDCGLRVSIHEFQRIAAPFLAQFLPYRIHDNPCCLYLKSHPDIWTACIRNQKRLSGYLEQGPFSDAATAASENMSIRFVTHFLILSSASSASADIFFRSIMRSTV